MPHKQTNWNKAVMKAYRANKKAGFAQAIKTAKKTYKKVSKTKKTKKRKK